MILAWLVSIPKGWQDYRIVEDFIKTPKGCHDDTPSGFEYNRA